jgi:lipopolysaccharide transport protein LptA
MKRLIVGAMILTMFSSPGWTQTAGEGDVVKIFSDSLQIMDRTGQVQFEGNVRAELSETILSCDKLFVRTSERDPSKVTSGMASGNVVMVRGQERIEAQEARFDLESATVDLTGSPRLLKGKTTILAERIVYMLDEGTAVFHGPVSAVFVAEGE